MMQGGPYDALDFLNKAYDSQGTVAALSVCKECMRGRRNISLSEVFVGVS